ncbi:MAG: universal stress protein [Muribaculaceae bacterium]|nr:universal stress protein [Muribaculaceae bacterium]
MRLITVAIHTYDHADRLRRQLNREGIEVVLQNVNLESPVVSSGIRVRIHEHDLPLALRIIENPDIFPPEDNEASREQREILVPVDFSHHSFNAACAAVRMAHMHGSDLKLLHTYIDPVVAGKMQLTDSLTYELTDADARKKIEEDAWKKMQRFVDALKDRMRAGELPAVKITAEMREGVPEDAIIQYVKSNPPLLVVMGTRSFEQKEREMIGSVCAQVLDGCRFSVLVIPENTNLHVLDRRIRMLFFANLDQEDILAVDTFYRVFPGMQTEATVVNIPGRRRLMERVRSDSPESLVGYFRKSYPDSLFSTADMAAAAAVDDFDRLQLQNQYDLLVVPNKKKSLLSRVFNPGLAHRLLFHADIPMLVIPV